MKRSTRRSNVYLADRFRLGVGAIVAVLALAAVTGCGAGQVAQTAEIQSHAGGAVARVGEIALLDVRFPYVGPISGDEVYPVGADAALRGTIVNSGDQPDRLLQILSPIARSAVLSGPIEVPPGSTLIVGWAGPPSPPGFPPDTRSYLGLAELTTPLRSGQSYPVEFRFERAGSVLVHVPIATPDRPRD
jgi:copper(I)-binding protein